MNNPKLQHKESQRYALFAILLHWITVASLVLIAAIGWYMSQLPDGAPGQESLYQLHKSLGITVLFLTIARIVWRLMNPPPPLPSDLSRVEKFLASFVHAGFYVLLFVIPLSGWVYVSTATDFQVPTVLYGIISWPHLPLINNSNVDSINTIAESAHSALVWATVALLILHVAGAVKHQFSGEEGVLHRMLIARKFPISLRNVAIAIVLPFFIFVSITLCSNHLTRTGDALQEPALPNTGNYVIDYDNSEIRFSGVHDGNNFSGIFENWSANINFHMFEPDQSHVTVNLQSASVKTGSRLYDEALTSSEWFDSANYPTIMVTVDEFSDFAGHFFSQATLTIKDRQVTVPFDFELSQIVEKTQMEGQAILSRESLDLGQVSDPDNEWVSDQIIVDVKVLATQKE